MSSLSILLKNTSATMLAGYFGMGVNFLITIILARYLGAEGFGIFVTAMIFAFFGGMLTDFGIETVIVRNVSRNKSDISLYYVNGFFLILGTALSSWMGIAAVVYFLGYSPYLKAVILLATSTLLFSPLSKISNSTLNALERMDVLSIVSLISTACYSLVAVLIVVLGYGIIILIVWGIVIQLIEGVSLFLIIRKIIRVEFSWKVQAYFCFDILKQSSPLGIMRFLNVINDKIDILMISSMIGSSTVAFYAVAVKIVNFFLVPSGSLNTAIMPHFSARLSCYETNVKKIYDEIVRVLILLSFPIAIIVTATAEEVINVLFGQAYVGHGSANALKILIWSFFFDVNSGPAGVIVLNLESKIMKFFRFALALALLNVSLNMFMIPTFGIIGASISTLICSFTRFIITISIVHRTMGKSIVIPKLLMKPSVCAALLYIVLLNLKEQNLIIGVAAGIVFYFSGLFLLKAITNEDIRIIRKIVLKGAGKIFNLS